MPVCGIAHIEYLSANRVPVRKCHRFHLTNDWVPSKSGIRCWNDLLHSNIVGLPKCCRFEFCVWKRKSHRCERDHRSISGRRWRKRVADPWRGSELREYLCGQRLSGSADCVGRCIGKRCRLANLPDYARNPLNIRTAACRPATFLHWVKGTPGNPGLWTQGGMCAQGASAGSGGLAYALAWYGEGSDLDKAVFLSGPVFSDIRK